MVPTTPASTTWTAQQLGEVAARLEWADPTEILAWAVANLPGVVVAASFEDLALVHLVHEGFPEVPIAFLDTGGHFPETLDFVEDARAAWSLPLVRVTPGPEADAHPCGTEGCCQLRKVAPLEGLLAQRSGWITGVKRVDAPTRATTPVVGLDEKFGVVKVNPLATWTDEDVLAYLERHELAHHPLWAQGYTSIGCAAVTRPPTTPGDRRSGRWAGSGKVECGLHEL